MYMGQGIPLVGGGIAWTCFPVPIILIIHHARGIDDGAVGWLGWVLGKCYAAGSVGDVY